MAKTKTATTMHMGPVSLLVFVAALCAAVLCTLALTSAEAERATTQRQIAFTNDVYANETVAQTFLFQVDTALGNGADALAAQLDSLVADASSNLENGSVTASMPNSSSLIALFETEQGRQLTVELRIHNTTYEIIQWKTSTAWKEENTETLWQGQED